MFFFLMDGNINTDTMRIQEEEISGYDFFGLDEIPADTFPCCKKKIEDYKTYTGRVILS